MYFLGFLIGVWLVKIKYDSFKDEFILRFLRYDVNYKLIFDMFKCVEFDFIEF